MHYEVMLGKGVGRGASILTYFSSLPLEPGLIVEVPLMRGRAPAVVLKKVSQPKFKCREITRILYSKPLPGHLIEVARWLSEYYQAPLSSVMQMILPVGILKKRRSIEGSNKTEQNRTDKATNQQVKQLSSLGPRRSRPSTPVGVVRVPRGGLPRGSRAPSRAAALRNPSGGQIASLIDIPLNPHQKRALEGLQKAPGRTKLLLGVTGSGKTNIYLKMALNALSGQKSVILLVPEIALTGQLVRVFKDTFGEIVTVIHSRQTEVERQKIFDYLLLSDGPRIVIGPRSALFAPLDNLGLIIVDEEHESTYYQENTPKYSAIRVASKMADEYKCSCILGSATPAVEDYFLAKERGTLVILSEKAKKTAIKPTIEIVDFKKRDNFLKNRYFSNSLLKAIEQNLKEKKQTLIFHNRRGSSPLTICENCGEELLCPNCFLPLTLHVDSFEMHCHTCGYKRVVPNACPNCGGAGLVHKGFGTKLLENELSRLFPDAKVKRFDADSKKGETLDALYSEVRDGEVDILVGTQTLAKGLDLPLLATVGVVQADSGLALPDFAAEERVFQLITQVIGRVGRGHLSKANVIIQTFQPEHPVLKFAVAEDYLGFSDYLLEQRRRSGFPPFLFVARASVTMKTEATVLKKVREAIKTLSANERLIVSPPAPAFHERSLRGFTWELTVRSSSRSALSKSLSMLDDNFHVSLDPPSLL